MTDVSILIQADADDAGEENSPLEFSSTETGITALSGAGFSGGESGDVNGGFRFAHADLPPKSATINAADMLTVAINTTNDNFRGDAYDIYCEDVDASVNFTTTAAIASRTRTTAVKTGNPNLSGMNASVHASLTSGVGFASVVQEVVDRAGWDEASLTVLLINNGGTTAVSGPLRIRSRENSTTLCARLDISYTVAAAAAGPLVGGKLVGHGILRGRLVA